MTDRCIVIGASAGGVETLEDVVSRLPPDLAVPVFVVLHIPPYVASTLPKILRSIGPLRALHPNDGDKIEGGVTYVAPPDHHLLVHEGSVAVKKGPKENRFRPSIDAPFRSAAYTYGKGAIGVVLSSALDDGTSGLWSIKRLGGISVMQSPNQARFDSMPRSALEYVEPDHEISSKEIGSLLGRLAKWPLDDGATEANELKERIATEVQIAAENGAFQKGVMKMGEPTPYTCPECHGVLVRISEGKMSRF